MTHKWSDASRRKWRDSESRMWPSARRAKLGKYLIISATSRFSLRPRYIFNLRCLTCGYFKSYYLHAWLDFYRYKEPHLIEHFKKKYFEYERHGRQHELH